VLEGGRVKLGLGFAQVARVGFPPRFEPRRSTRTKDDLLKGRRLREMRQRRTTRRGRSIKLWIRLWSVSVNANVNVNVKCRSQHSAAGSGSVLRGGSGNNFVQITPLSSPFPVQCSKSSLTFPTRTRGPSSFEAAGAGKEVTNVTIQATLARIPLWARRA
jgi:hypothetical protein